MIVTKVDDGYELSRLVNAKTEEKEFVAKISSREAVDLFLFLENIFDRDDVEEGLANIFLEEEFEKIKNNEVLMDLLLWRYKEARENSYDSFSLVKGLSIEYREEIEGVLNNGKNI